MPTNENNRQAHMTLMARILALQPILFHIIAAEGHYMLCSIEEIFLQKESRAV